MGILSLSCCFYLQLYYLQTQPGYNSFKPYMQEGDAGPCRKWEEAVMHLEPQVFISCPSHS